MITEREELADLIERGGVYGDIKGTTPREALTNFIKALSPVPPIPGDKLLEAVMEREALMSTSIGGGIALPHPRNPLAAETSEQFAAVAFLEKSVDWNSLDGEPVDTLLLIVSSSAKQHLRTLSEITFFCRQEDFKLLLKNHASREELLRFIREAEKKWT
jgi:PTS system nitrogen regulatory IIA component